MTVSRSDEDRELYYRVETATPLAAPELMEPLARALTRLWERVMGGGTDAERAAESLGRWLPLLGRPGFANERAAVAFLARVVTELPEGQARLVTAALTALRAAFEARPPGHVWPPAVRTKLAQAARREEALGWSAIVDLAVMGLPESLPELEQLLPQSSFKNAAIVARHQRDIVASADPQARERGLYALYGASGAEHARELLPALSALAGGPERPPRPELWRGVGAAALARPLLQRALIAHLFDAPVAALWPVVARIADEGLLGEEADARRLLARAPAGVTAASPPSGPSPLPWSRDERAALARLVRSSDPPESGARRALERLVELQTTPAADLVVDVLEALQHRLGEPEVQALVVELGLGAKQRRVLGAAAKALLRARVENGVPLAPSARIACRDRAERVVDGVDWSLALARLSLPEGLELWSALRRKLVPVTEVGELDFALALQLLGEAPEVMRRLMAETTPNQRRLFLARVALGPAAGRVPVLIEALRAVDPGALPLLYQRLEAAGLAVEAGGLALAVDTSEAGGLAIHAEPSASELGALSPDAPSFDAVRRRPDDERPAASPALAVDPRLQLEAPPRRVGPHIVLAHVLFAANGWGVLWTTGLAFAAREVILNPRRMSPTMILLAVAVWLLNHHLAGTLRVLQVLRRGIVLAATVTVTKTTKRSKGSSTTTYHHHLEVLDDSGRTRTHRIDYGREQSALIDEPVEPILARLDADGVLEHVVPIDTLRLVRVGPRRRFVLVPRVAWLALVLVAPWLVLAFDALT